MAANTILDIGVRTDLADAHRAVATTVARPGTWWTAAARVAIAEQVRVARQEPERPPWDSPSDDPVVFDPNGPLPAAAVDAVWRITNHPGTLTADWYERIVADLESPEQYVELVGLVAMVNSIDRFADHLELTPIAFSPPTDGGPSRELVETEVTSHWVPTAPLPGPNVSKALSAVPDVHRLRGELSDAQYVPGEMLLADLDWSRGTIDRRQIELIAARTSIRNECFY